MFVSSENRNASFVAAPSLAPTSRRLFLRAAWLVLSSDPSLKADAILSSAARASKRPLEAVRLYKAAGAADRVIAVSDYG